MAKKYLDSDGLLYYNQKVNAKLEKKVDKVDGKGLSTNDYTTTEKNKLAGIEAGANKTVINNTLTSTSTTEALSANQGKVLWEEIEATNEEFGIWVQGINNAIPKDNSQLTNGAGYQTESQVNTLIGNAISDIQGISYEVVTKLPTTGEAGVIYLVSNSGSNPNSYDEYIYANGKFEKIGTTDVDLTDYALKSELPTKVSQLTNDKNYVVSSNLKTINGLSLLGSGNIDTLPTFSTSNWFNNADGIYKHSASNGNLCIVMVMTMSDGGKNFVYFDPDVNTTIYSYTQASSTSDLQCNAIINFNQLLNTDYIEYSFTKEQASADEWTDSIPTIYAVYKYIEDNIQAITNAEIDTICQ